MARGDQLGRQWRIIQTLLTSRTGKSEVAGYIRKKIWHESQKMEAQEDGSLLFEAVVAGTQEIKYWTLGWGPMPRFWNRKV